tara:strand:- start:134592 stop:138338 length:3747 start_codon:yes stop_codon:yes gene_type:complete
MIIKRSARVLLMLCIVFVGLMIFIVSSNTGLRWVITVAQQVLPIQLNVGNIKGRIIGPIQLTNIQYGTDYQAIKIDDLHVDWHPINLLTSRVNISQLQVNNISITKLADDPSPSTFALPNNITLHHIAINKLSYQTAHGKPTTIDQINLSGQTIEGRLDLTQLLVRYQQHKLTLSGQVKLKPVYADLNFQAYNQDKLVFQTHLSAKGQPKKFTLQNKITVPMLADINGEIDHTQGNANWKAFLHLHALDLETVNKTQHSAAIYGNINAQGNFQHYTATGKLSIKATKGRLDATPALSFNSRGQRENGKMQFVFNGQWKQLFWPLFDTAAVASPTGKITINGTPDDYHYTISSNLNGLNVPTSTVNLEGSGTNKTISIKKAVISTLGGQLAGNLRVTWEPQLNWHINLTGQKLNPAKHWLNWPGELNFSLSNEGDKTPKGINSILHINHVKGKLRQQSLGGHASLLLENNELTSSDINLSMGASHVSLSGSIKNLYKVDWQVTAPNLQAIVPWATGQISSSGHITGKLFAPDIKLQLHIQGFAWQNNQIDSLTANGYLGLDANHDSQLFVNANNIAIGQYILNGLQLHFSGTKAQENLDAGLQVQNENLHFKLEGAYNNKNWQGHLKALDLRSPLLGHWSLQKSSPLGMGEKQFYLHDFCWLSGKQKICADANWQQKKPWQAKLNVNQLKLSGPLRFLSNNNLSLSSTLNINAAINADAENIAQGKIDIALTPGDVNYLPTHYQTQINGGHWNTILDTKGITSHLQLLIDAQHFIKLNVSLPGYQAFKPLPEQQQTKGSLNINMGHLNVLPLLLPQFTQADGSLTSDINWNGTLAKPLLQGRMKLIHAHLHIDSTNTDVNQLNVSVSADGHSHFNYDGQANIGKGKLSLQGKTEFNETGPNSIVKIKGDALNIMNTRNYQVTMSPDLTLTTKAGSIHLDGSVYVPSANIFLNNLAGSVTLPQETVFVNNEENNPEPEELRNFYANIHLKLGDNIKFSSDDFSGKLAGELAITDRPKQTTIANGELRVLDGVFEVYGSKLHIDNGKLLYAGNDVANPGLSIRATKNITSVGTVGDSNVTSATGQLQNAPIQSNVTVGVQVQGNVNKPNVSLFSIPAGLSEADILSYLVLGYPSSSASAGEGQAIWQAANALSLGGADVSKIRKQLQNTLGLDELTVQSGSYVDSNSQVQNNTSLVLGKMLTPRIFVSYSIGMVEAVNTLNVSYKVSDNWTIKTDSGTLGNGADLIFTIEP